MRHPLQILESIAAILFLTGCGEAVIDELFNPQNVATAHLWYENNRCVDTPYRTHAFSETLYTQTGYDDGNYSNFVDKTTGTITEWNINGFIMIRARGGTPTEYVCTVTANQEPFRGDPDSITLQCITAEEASTADAFLSTMWKTKELAATHPCTACE
jgi:hypothetical protein